MIASRLRPAALALALLALPATATAEPTHLLTFHVHGAHGYRIIVNADKVTASLTATRAKQGAKSGSLSTYLARRAPGTAAIRTTFGTLGRISMRFHPSGPATKTKPQPDCEGPDHFTIQPGFFVGKLRFRGEDGYTSAHAHRVAGKSVTPPTLDCSGAIIPARANLRAHRHVPKVAFEAGFRQGLLYEALSATHEPGHPTQFFASLRRTEGDLAIQRFALAKAPPRSLRTDSALSFATLKPPAPFSGTGSLTRKPTGARLWAGTLAVSFPGEPDVQLTGPLFKTRLTRAW